MKCAKDCRRSDFLFKRFNIVRSSDNAFTKIAEIVVVGGVRRSALISLSDLDDGEMRHAKSGQWWEQNVQRSLAINSVNYKEKPNTGTFMREWLSLYDS